MRAKIFLFDNVEYTVFKQGDIAKEKVLTGFTKDSMRNKLSRIFLCLYIFLLFIPNISIAGVITIGTSYSQHDHVPIEPYYAYTYSQCLYLQSEIDAGGPIYIDSIKFHWDGDGSWTDNIVVYMGHTTYSSFPNDWKPVSSMTQVYSGSYSVSSSAGWYTIVLDEPFYYNDTVVPTYL